MKNYIEFPLWLIVVTFLSLCLWQCRYANASGFFGTGTSEPSHIHVGPANAEKIYMGTDTTAVWQQVQAGPPITTFTVAPSTIDLDTRSSGTISFTAAVTGKTGNDTTCQIVRLPDGTPVGTSFLGVGGANISETVPNIAQPSSTTIYRLLCHYSGGGSNLADRTVTVTKNAGVSACSFRAVPGGQSAPLAETLHITCTITGTPRPTVTITGWNDGNAFTDRHFTSTGTNQWSFTASRFFGSVEARDVTVVATNSTFTARLVARYVP